MTFQRLPTNWRLYLWKFLEDIEGDRLAQVSKACLTWSRELYYSPLRWQARLLQFRERSLPSVKSEVVALNARVIAQLTGLKSQPIDQMIAHVVQVQEPSRQWRRLRSCFLNDRALEMVKEQLFRLIEVSLVERDSAAVFLLATVRVKRVEEYDGNKCLPLSIQHGLKDAFNHLIACKFYLNPKSIIRAAIAKWKEEPYYLKHLIASLRDNECNLLNYWYQDAADYADNTGDFSILDYLETTPIFHLRGFAFSQINVLAHIDEVANKEVARRIVLAMERESLKSAFKDDEIRVTRLLKELAIPE